MYNFQHDWKFYPFTISNELCFIWISNFDNQFEKIEQASPGFIFDLLKDAQLDCDQDCDQDWSRLIKIAILG